MKFFKIVIVVLFLVLCAGVFVWYFAKDTKSSNKKTENMMVSETKDVKQSPIKKLDTEQNNQWNQNNKGLIARYGDYYYYSDPTFGILYRVSLDGSKRDKITGERNTEYINVEDDWIYYTGAKYGIGKDKNIVKTSGNVYKVKIDGTNKFTSKLNAGKLVIGKQGTIYFTDLNDKGRLYRVLKSLTNPVKLTEETWVKEFYLTSDSVYYSTQDGIYKIMQDGTANNKELSIGGVLQFGVSGEYIYILLDSGKLMRSLVKTPQKTELLTSNVKSFFVKENSVYYTNWSNEYGITKLGLEKSVGENISPKIQTTGLVSHIGNMLFSSEKVSDSKIIRGFNFKSNFEGTMYSEICNAKNELSLGLNMNNLLDAIDRDVKIDDRNLIMRKIESKLTSYLDGNCSVVKTFYKDIDNDGLSELLFIYKQLNTDTSTVKQDILQDNMIQVIFTGFKWDGYSLVKYSDIEIKNSENIIKNEYIEPNIYLKDLEKGGLPEIIIQIGSKIKDFTIYRVKGNKLEIIDNNVISNKFDYKGNLIGKI